MGFLAHLGAPAGAGARKVVYTTLAGLVETMGLSGEHKNLRAAA
jgi:hypothetical protein